MCVLETIPRYGALIVCKFLEASDHRVDRLSGVSTSLVATRPVKTDRLARYKSVRISLVSLSLVRDIYDGVEVFVVRVLRWSTPQSETAAAAAASILDVNLNTNLELNRI